MFRILLFAALLRTLPPGESVKGGIAGGQARSFAVDLQKDQYFHIELTQTGIDLGLRLLGPDSRMLIEIDETSQGAEHLHWIARTPGQYRIDIYTADPTAKPGAFKIRLEQPATPSPEQRARALDNSARGHQKRNEYESAIADLDASIFLWHDLGQAEPQARSLNQLGSIYDSLSRYDQAISVYQQAIAICRESKIPFGEASILNNLGALYDSTGQSEKAITQYERSLHIRREIKDRRGEAEALANIGASNQNLTRYDRALEYYHQSLVIQREVRNRDGEGAVVNNMGTLYSLRGDYGQAITFYEQALAIRREQHDQDGEANSLLNLGLAYRHLSQTEKAIQFYEQALPMFLETRDRRGEAVTLNNLGQSWVTLNEYEKALSFYNRALPILRETRDLMTERTTLNNIAAVHHFLGDYAEAIPRFEEALALSRKIKDRAGEAETLGNLAASWGELNQRARATDLLRSALALDRELGDRSGQAILLNNLGRLEREQGRPHESLRLLSEALPIEREIGDRHSESSTLNNLGKTYRQLGFRDKATEAQQQAAALAHDVHDRMAEAAALSELAGMAQQRQRPRLATFYAKQSVNLIQEVRGGIRGLSQESRESFLKRNAATYRLLAGLLIAQGRLAEAQQAMNLLKEQEYFGFVRRDSARSGLDGRSDLTVDEAEWARRYAEVADRLVGLGTRYNELRGKRSKSAEEEAEVKRIDGDLRAGNQAFQRVLAGLTQQLGGKDSRAGLASAVQLKDIEAFGDDLAELQHGAVAVYALEGEDKLRIILVTPSVRRAYESLIRAEDLNHKIAAFREVLQNPTSDPLPLARELYRILFIPALAEDLRQAKAETLMLSLDGALRYLPFAALHDGRQYVVEKYRLALFTPASNARLKDKPKADWNLVGFGVTRPFGDFSALPNVANELNGIVKGILPGETLMDDAFTEVSMTDQLRRGFDVVHIATHFNFQPGDETKSFLLLGDGSHLSLADIDSMSNPFRGVDLLTLSGCNTGIGDGREIEGLGIIAQRKGAKSVIASLWPVADESTSRLMQEFYRVRQSAPGVLKAEALRQAQIAMLKGKLAPGVGPATDRGVRVVGRAAAASRDKSYSHPYYWAPFFLVGNWL